MNPYETLGIQRNATDEEIEDAYDALFDEYEPLAHEGDQSSIEMLNALNDARDTLLDLAKRSRLDAALNRPRTERPPQRTQQGGPAVPQQNRQPRSPSPTAERAASQRPRAAGRPGAGSTTVRTRRRASYALEPELPRRNWLSYWPYYVVLLVLGFAIAFGTTFLTSRGSCIPDDLPTGATVATVNGVPVYQRELDVREQIDKSGALSDPLFSSFFDPTTITGTRALDTLKFDSLDKLVNMQVILQQARKEGIWPTDEQAAGLVSEAASADQKPGETYEQMLCRLKVSDNKYRQTVIENVVYTVMADHHMPTEGDAAQRTDGFIKWICDTRANYDVQILMNFLVTNNPPCTSGLPSDLPLPGLDQPTPIPEDIPTAVVPVDGTDTGPAAPAPNATTAP
jgi:hypothetical protein